LASTSQAEVASRREARRQQRHELGRGQLLDAAEEVFGEVGFHAATLKDIAERAEFSVGSVYSFFENKDDLFLSVFLRRGDELLPAMRAVVDGSGSPLEQVHGLVDVEVGFFRQHPHFGRVYLRTSSAINLSPERDVDQAMQSRFREAMDLQASVFARGQRQKLIRPGDPQVLARLLSGLVGAFQATDPAVIDDEPPAAEPLALADLHDIVERAFAA
jgi:TetR/AcrR family transcriptional regulator